MADKIVHVLLAASNAVRITSKRINLRRRDLILTKKLDSYPHPTPNHSQSRRNGNKSLRCLWESNSFNATFLGARRQDACGEVSNVKLLRLVAIFDYFSE